MEFLKVRPKETFGTLSFVGKPIKGAEFTQGSGQNRKHVGNYCRLLSSRQSETIEIIFPTRVNLNDFNFGDVVSIEDVKVEPMSESTGSGAITGWRLFAQSMKKGNE
ncbi:DUF961 family protein [Enterococcus faecium]|uniref:DUF961 family protein n=1 Tax=Enterococcus faecium TaxID=1352 RepID=UPI000BEFD4B8|nr:DUF961 family protein [Enterococcus faecium]PEH49620.1 DUF961 domain-containing protein [Enterococcus faecium]